jgi:O-antigen/teichoic acid export membrane protein
MHHTNRTSIFLKGLTSSAGAQIVSFILGLISVPLGLNYLGAIQYGIWIVISSIVTYMGLSQFGIGTASATLMAKNDNKQVRGAIFRRTFVLLCYISIILIILSSIAATFQEKLGAMFGDVSNELRIDGTVSTVILVILTLIRLPIVAVLSAFFGIQEVWWERLYASFLPNLVNFLALLLAIYFKGGLVMLALLTGGFQLLVGLIAGLHLYVRHNYMYCKIDGSNSFCSNYEGIISNSGRFFIISIASMVVWYTDNLIINYYFGPESVTAYSVTFKLFTAVITIFTIANMILLPMFGNSASKGDWLWMNDVYKAILSINIVLGGGIWIVGILFAKSIILTWVGETGYGGELVVFSLGGYAYILSSVNLNSNILIGMNFNRKMVWFGIAEATLNFVLSMLFVRFLGIGGVALGTCMSSLLTVYWLLPLDLDKQTNSKLKTPWSPTLQHFIFAVFPGVSIAYYISFSMSGINLLVSGIFLCLVYLAISLLILPAQVKSMIMKLSLRVFGPKSQGLRSRFFSNGRGSK